MSRPTNPLPRPVVDIDAQTITFAVTFDWRREGIHLDQCEAAVVCGELRRATIAHFQGAEWNQLARLTAVQTWYPPEEQLIGRGFTGTDLYQPEAAHG